MYPNPNQRQYRNINQNTYHQQQQQQQQPSDYQNGYYSRQQQRTQLQHRQQHQQSFTRPNSRSVAINSLPMQNLSTFKSPSVTNLHKNSTPFTSVPPPPPPQQQQLSLQPMSQQKALQRHARSVGNLAKKNNYMFNTNAYQPNKSYHQQKSAYMQQWPSGSTSNLAALANAQQLNQHPLMNNPMTQSMSNINGALYNQQSHNMMNNYHHALQQQQPSSYVSAFANVQHQQQRLQQHLQRNTNNNTFSANTKYNTKPLPSNPNVSGYGLQVPSQDFVQQLGAFAMNQVYANNAYGYNSTWSVPPPPPPSNQISMGSAATKTKHHSKKKKRRHKKSGKKKKHRHKKSKKKHSKHKSKKKKSNSTKKKQKRKNTRPKSAKNNSSSLSVENKNSNPRSIKQSTTSESDSSDSPPPPPPNYTPNGSPLPLSSSVPGGGEILEDDESTSSESSDSERILPDPGNIPDASTEFAVLQKKNRKAEHKRFDSRNEFLRRRPVSGLPLNVQKKLNSNRNTSDGSGETPENISSHLRLIKLKITHKTSNTIKFLHECLLKEVLFQGMDNAMIDDIISVMYKVECPANECIIRQDEYGDAYFVIQFGAFDIIHQEINGSQPKRVGQMLPGKAFGEGSLLYSIPRAATLKATKTSIVWALDAAKFLEIRQKISQQVNDSTSRMVKLLKKIPLFKKYGQQDLVSIAQAVEERKYIKDSTIVKQGDDSTEFFIIKTGRAVARINKAGESQTVKEYGDSDYFGERGLYLEEKRAASVISMCSTRVFVIKKHDFISLLASPLSKHFETQIKAYDDLAFETGFGQKYKNLVQVSLETLLDNNLGILGVGSFGRVSLVKDPKTSVTYSLKKVRKNKVIETGQQEHVRNERAVLALLDSDFCCRMYGTFQDKWNIYFLMEPILGGELFTVLRWNKKFSERTARFYAACVVLAFESLHAKNIIYRDLKPENLLIAKNGYCKLVDFGFAKRRNNSCTLCGTPEYLSPEVIQNYPQSFPVDWWALGIFIYEIIVGHAPFQDDPDVKMYEKILTFDVKFPEDGDFTPRVTDIVQGLLNKNAYKRYGANANGTMQVMKHPWFNGLDWNKMRAQNITPPYVPNIQNDEDVSNYDNYPEENIDEVLDEPTAYEWCEDF